MSTIQNNLFTIGEVSKIKGLSIKALRFYDKIGLLKPHFVDSDTRYRYYHIDQFMTTDLIIAARAMHVSPYTLVPYFAGKDSKSLTAVLFGQKEKITAEIEKLNKALAYISNVKAVLDYSQTSIQNDSIYTRFIPSRYVLTRPYNEESFDEIIVSYSLIDTQIMQNDLTNSFESGAYFLISQEGVVPEYIFCTISETAEQLDAYRVIEQGRYFCIVATKDNAEQQASKLFEHIEKEGLEPDFFIQTELITNLFTVAQPYYEFQAKIRE